VNDWEAIAIPTSLSQLGYRGWRVRYTDVEFIAPPTCAVAAGAFDMGSTESDPQAFENETPQFRLAVAAFAIGTYPVTVAEYACYLQATPSVAGPTTIRFGDHQAVTPAWCGKELSWDLQRQQRPDHPVVCVTWFNAWDYAAWLAQTTGQVWRLPTEAEWEKAARWDEAHQHARIYPWGDAYDPSRCNTADEQGKARQGLGQTTPVGRYPSSASPSGAQDMAGNVWEWCSSLYSERYPYDPAHSEDDGRDRAAVRVQRGGQWGVSPRLARAADRIWSYPDFTDIGRGFRLARLR
jgi:formylglycine-generating enzyme required for sulfatase activity